MKPHEYARVIITGSTKDDWFKELEGQEVLALVEFSIFNGELRLFSAKPVTLPVHLGKHLGRPIKPQHILIT